MQNINTNFISDIQKDSGTKNTTNKILWWTKKIRNLLNETNV